LYDQILLRHYKGDVILEVTFETELAERRETVRVPLICIIFLCSIDLEKGEKSAATIDQENDLALVDDENESHEEDVRVGAIVEGKHFFCVY